MIFDIISSVLLLAILAVLFLVLKRVAAIESPQIAQTQQEVSDTLPEEVSDFDVVNEAFIAYIARESGILQYADFGEGGHSDYIGYESGYPKESRYYDIWITAWLPRNRNEIAAVISIASNSSYVESHYKNFEENKNKIEKAFSFENINPRGKIGNVFQLSVVKRDVDLTQTANWDTEFRWLRENLEKLYWVLRVHDTLGWDTASSTENSSEDDIPF